MADTTTVGCGLQSCIKRLSRFLVFAHPVENFGPEKVEILGELPLFGKGLGGLVCECARLFVLPCADGHFDHPQAVRLIEPRFEPTLVLGVEPQDLLNKFRVDAAKDFRVDGIGGCRQVGKAGNADLDLTGHYELEIITNYTNVADQVPQSLVLLPATPNPFNPATTFRFSLPNAGQVDLAIYDARGRRIRTLVRDVLAAGRHSSRSGRISSRPSS